MPPEEPVAGVPPSVAGDQDFTKMPVNQIMKLYYSWLFPHQEMYKWLSYGNDGKHPQSDATFFQRREFCFTLDGDIFVRYQSFKDGTEMQNAIRDRCPAKIDIGPVYNVDPQRRAAYAANNGFAPQERELVFDIDLTDYDDVRTCGKEGHICSKCWPLMAAAIAILDRGLREDFGFEHVLFVYSGRRGVHAWVCDERARRLTDEQRSAIANYFAMYKGQEKGRAKLATGLEDHPSVSAAHEILMRTFEERILPRQKLLEDPAHAEAMLSYLPSEAVRAEVRSRWASLRPPKRPAGDSTEETAGKDKGWYESTEKWNALTTVVSREAAALVRTKDMRGAKIMEKAVKDIVFAYSYPRLDMEVSKKMNHLLKAPFCVHPKTGKVCVPIDPGMAWEFNPDEVATVGGLLNQLNAKEKMTGGNGGDSWSKTDMRDAVSTFRECFLDALLVESKEKLAAKGREAAAAPTMAW